MSAPEFRFRKGKFFLDTGSDASLIKLRALHEDLRVDTDEVIKVSGIAEKEIMTLGTVQIYFTNKPTKFHVMYDLPIEADALIGKPYFREEKAEISFNHNTMVTQSDPIKPKPFLDTNPHLTNKVLTTGANKIFRIKARSRQPIEIEIKTKDLKEGYLPRVSTPRGIYLGEAIVSQDNGHCHVMAINTLSEDVEFNLEAQEIQPFHYCSPNDESDLEDATSTDPEVVPPEDRVSAILAALRLDHLNDQEKNHVCELVEEFPNLYKLPGDKLQCTDRVYHRIPTTDDLPINTKQYRFPVVHREEIDKQILTSLDEGIIVPSTSPFNSPVWIVPKKPDSQGRPRMRMVIDFRKLNEKTISDAYPLPNIIDILDQLGQAQYFSTFDLASGFHQIPMDPQDRPKTAFSTLNGHYEYARMPFGLKNAPATFQRLMDNVLRGLQGTELFVYLDDVVVFAKNLEEHKIKVRRLMRRFEQANLSLQPDKCEFLRREVTDLGHIVAQNGLRMDPRKLRAVEKFPLPKTQKNV